MDFSAVFSLIGRVELRQYLLWKGRFLLLTRLPLSRVRVLVWSATEAVMPCWKRRRLDYIVVVLRRRLRPRRRPSTSTATTSTAWPLLQYNSGREGRESGRLLYKQEGERESQTRIEQAAELLYCIQRCVPAACPMDFREL